MNQFKPAQVIMLPTENENQGIYLSPVPSINKIHYWDKRISNSYIAQHLYITSDDKIEDSDWCINLAHNILVKPTDLEWANSNKDNLKKVVATTNVELGYGDNVGFWKSLPQPPQQFIEQYIEYYNKGEVITDALVEYETYQDTINYHKDIWKNFERIKINPKDNTITIKKVKTNWNREEIIEFGEKIREYCKNGYRSDSLHKVFYEWDKWLEENL